MNVPDFGVFCGRSDDSPVSRGMARVSHPTSNERQGPLPRKSLMVLHRVPTHKHTKWRPPCVPVLLLRPVSFVERVIRSPTQDMVRGDRAGEFDAVNLVRRSSHPAAAACRARASSRRCGALGRRGAGRWPQGGGTGLKRTPRTQSRCAVPSGGRHGASPSGPPRQQATTSRHCKATRSQHIPCKTSA